MKSKCGTIFCSCVCLCSPVLVCMCAVLFLCVFVQSCCCVCLCSLVFVCFEGEKWDNVWAMCNNKKKWNQYAFYLWGLLCVWLHGWVCMHQYVAIFWVCTFFFFQCVSGWMCEQVAQKLIKELLDLPSACPLPTFCQSWPAGPWWPFLRLWQSVCTLKSARLAHFNGLLNREPVGPACLNGLCVVLFGASINWALTKLYLKRATLMFLLTVYLMHTKAPWLDICFPAKH